LVGARRGHGRGKIIRDRRDQSARRAQRRRNAQLGDGSLVALDTIRSEIEEHWKEFSHEGHRVLGVAYRA
jgi:magnesium-transporting ATPase (P-type)